MGVSPDQFVCNPAMEMVLFDVKFIKDGELSLLIDWGRVGAALLDTLGSLSSTTILIFDPGIASLFSEMSMHVYLLSSYATDFWMDTTDSSMVWLVARVFSFVWAYPHG